MNAVTTPPQLTNADVAAVLAQCKFPPTDPAMLQAVLRKEGRAFGAAVMAVRNRDPDLVDKRAYMRDLILCVCEPSLARLKEAGFEIPLPSVMSDIAKNEGATFYQSVAKLSDTGSIGEAARNYLSGIFAVYRGDNAVPAQPQAGGGPAAAVAAEAEGQGRAGGEGAELPCRVGNDDDDGKPNIECVRLYGGRSAICFTADIARKDKQPTIRIDGTKSTGPQQYDWTQKIMVQLSPHELPAILSVLLGKIAEHKSSGRGDAHNKLYHLKQQAGGYLVTVGQGREIHAVPLAATAAFPLLSLFMKQILAGNPHLTDMSVLAMINSLANAQSRPSP